jgi:uncharacterized FlaG/YvyC family protein
MNTILPTNTPHIAGADMPAAKPMPEMGSGPQLSVPVAPEMPTRKPSVIAMDTSGVSKASVRENSQPLEKVVAAAADAIQKFIASQGSNLNITVDEVTGFHIIRVTDSNGNQVMTMPSEAAIRVAHNMQGLQGLFVDHTA